MKKQKSRLIDLYDKWTEEKDKIIILLFTLMKHYKNGIADIGWVKVDNNGIIRVRFNVELKKIINIRDMELMSIVSAVKKQKNY